MKILMFHRKLETFRKTLHWKKINIVSGSSSTGRNSACRPNANFFLRGPAKALRKGARCLCSGCISGINPLYCTLIMVIEDEVSI